MAEKRQFIPIGMREPHYSTKLWRAYANYLEKSYGPDFFQQICNELNVPVTHLLTDGNWVSDNFTNEFMRVLKRRSGQEDIARIVGRYTLSPDNINAFEYALMKTMPPFLFFLLFPWEASKVNHYGKFNVASFRPGKITYHLNPLFSNPPHKDVCVNAVGVLEGAGDLFKLNTVKVTHPSCVHEGGGRCHFEVRYSARGWLISNILKAIFVAIVLVSVFLLGSMVSRDPDAAPLAIKTLSTAFCIAIFGLLFVIRKSSGIIKFNAIHHQQAKTLNSELFESYKKIDRRYHESNLLRGLSEQLLKSTDPDSVIRFCADQLVQRFGYSKILVLLLNADGTKLYGAEVRGFSSNSKKISSLELSYPAQSDDPLLFANVLTSGKTVFISDMDNFSSRLTKQNQFLLAEVQLNGLIVTPLQSGEDKYGLLVTAADTESKALNEEDCHMFENVARLLSMFFQRSKHFQKEQVLRSMFQKYVPSLVFNELNVQGLSARRRCITSMFVDMRGFSTLSETNAPERIVQLVNRYVDFVGKILGSHGGIIDNILGDGIVVFFANDESPREHAKAAVSAAREILAALPQLNTELAQIGFEDVSIGIGIHSGAAVVGAIGSDHKLSYTAIGDTINVAARLQELGKKFQQRGTTTPSIALVSADTIRMAGLENQLKDVGLEQIRGRREQIQVFLLESEISFPNSNREVA